MEWQIFLSIGTIATFLITIIKPIANLIASITKLTTLVDALKKNFDDITQASKKDHEEIGGKIIVQDSKIVEHDKKLAEHEFRILHVENTLVDMKNV